MPCSGSNEALTVSPRLRGLSRPPRSGIGEAESLHRVPGDLLMPPAIDPGPSGTIVRPSPSRERQSAKLFQLRASTSLARLWRDQGKHTEARDLLRPIYNWFTEGFDAPDLKDAKALLDELA